jgi:carboxypeptidase family protein
MMPFTTAPPSGFVTGRVVDGEGAPIGGVSVTCSRFRQSGRCTTSATCDAGGRFRLGPLIPDAKAKLHFDAPGVGRERREGVVVFASADHDLGDVVIPKGLVVTGVVVDEAGRRIDAATVSVHCLFHIRTGSTEAFGDVVLVSTSADGRFETPRFATTHDLGSITLRAERPIRGRVVDPEGRPIAHAGVWSTFDYDHVAETNDEGWFELHGDASDAPVLEIRRNGFVNQRDVKVDRAKELTVVLQRACEVTGTIVDDESGEPVKVTGVGLGMLLDELPGVMAAVENGCEVSESSRFRLWYEEPAEYELAAGAVGYEPGRLKLGRLEPPQDRHGVVLRMRRRTSEAAIRSRAEIYGRVSGLPSGGIVGLASLSYRISVLGTGSQPVVRGAVLPRIVAPFDVTPLLPDGSFTFDDVGGTALLRIDRPGEAPLLHGPLRLTSGEKRRIDVVCTPPAILTGRLTGVPAGFEGEAWVVLQEERGITNSVRAGRDGRFSIALDAGRYALRAGIEALFESPIRFAESAWVNASPGELARHLEPLAEIDLSPGEQRDLGDVGFRLPPPPRPVG